MQESTTTQQHNHLTTILCCFFFTGMTLTSGSFVVAPIGLLICALITLPKTKHHFTDKTVKLTCIALALFFITQVASVVIKGGDISRLDLPSRALLVLPILPLLMTFKPSLKWVMYAISLGGVLTGFIASYFAYVLHTRAFISLGYMVIQYGGLCALLGVLSFCVYFYALQTKAKKLSIWAYFGYTLALMACLLSGARGAWVLTPFILITIAWLNRSLMTKKRLVYLVLSCIIILSAAYPEIKNRTDAMVSDLHQYSHTNTNTSSGARLEMWKSALYSAKDKPIFGQGYNNLMEQKKLQIKAGLVTPVVLKFNSAHNQYLQELQVKGLIGLLVLLIMLGVPLRSFIKAMQGTYKLKPDYFFTGLLGASFILVFAGCCLTQHFFNHHTGILTYSTGIMILTALMLNTRDSSDKV